MDRRQKKTRELILKAFIKLLSKKSYSAVTVGQIIQTANVGRATFYAHFETKDYLLKELCKELFDHVFDCYSNTNNDQQGLFCCDAPDSTFLHLFIHLKKNDNNILKLLTSENTHLFMEYFQENLNQLIISSNDIIKQKKPSFVPDSYWTNHVSSCFISTLKWWIKESPDLSPEEITSYFINTI